MNIIRIDNRIKWINRFFSAEDLSSIKDFCLGLEKSYEVNLKGARQSSGLLLIEILYALTRHRIWHESPSFKVFLSDYIAASYEVSFEKSKNFLEVIQKYCLNHFSAIFPEPVNNDQEFLKYLVVNVVLSTNEVALEEDIGLGGTFIKKIKKIVLRDIASDYHSFTQDAEYKFCLALHELLSESQKKENYFHLKRFEYFLLEHRPPKIKDFDQNLVIQIIENLLIIGLGFEATQKSLSKEALESLLSFDLIYLKDRLYNQNIYALTESAAELTSYFVYESFVKRGIPDAPETLIAGLNAYYQKALLQAFHTTHQQKSLDFIRDNFSSIIPKALNLLLDATSDEYFCDALLDIIRTNISHNDNSFQKRDLTKVHELFSRC